MQTARGVYSSALGPNSTSRVPSRKSCRFIKAETTHREGSHMKGGKGEKKKKKGKMGNKAARKFQRGSGFADNMFHNVLQQGADSGQ